ncbi:transcriptional regulator [bacterium]|nr:MAG: transcriptional regulator [bacterium]
MAQNCRFAFAVHVLSSLALSEDGAMNSEQLAETVNTNPVVIRRLLLDLREANLLITQRGPGGGAKLACPSSQISLAQIFKAVSGEFQLFGEHPNEPAKGCCVGRSIKLVLEDVAQKAARCVEKEYAAISLADVVHQLQEK